MTYEDIENMSPEDAKKVIEELIAIAAAVAFLGVAIPIPLKLAEAARKFDIF